jgi:hypothetical protein
MVSRLTKKMVWCGSGRPPSPVVWSRLTKQNGAAWKGSTFRRSSASWRVAADQEDGAVWKWASTSVAARPSTVAATRTMVRYGRPGSGRHCAPPFEVAADQEDGAVWKGLQAPGVEEL